MQITNNIKHSQISKNNNSPTFQANIYYSTSKGLKTLKGLNKDVEVNKNLPLPIQEFITFVDKIGLKSLYKKMGKNDYISLGFFNNKYKVTRINHHESSILTAFLGEKPVLFIYHDQPAGIMKKYLEEVESSLNERPRKRLGFGEYINYLKFKIQFDKLKKISQNTQKLTEQNTK